MSSRAVAGRRLALWIATVAMVFACVAPTLAHAVVQLSGAAEWAEVCTGHGTRLVAVTDVQVGAQAVPDDAVNLSDGYCPACHLGTPAAMPPSWPETPILIGSDHDSTASARSPGFRTTPTWPSSRSRAPPAVG